MLTSSLSVVCFDCWRANWTTRRDCAMDVYVCLQAYPGKKAAWHFIELDGYAILVEALLGEVRTSSLLVASAEVPRPFIRAKFCKNLPTEVLMTACSPRLVSVNQTVLDHRARGRAPKGAPALPRMRMTDCGRLVRELLQDLQRLARAKSPCTVSLPIPPAGPQTTSRRVMVAPHHLLANGGVFRVRVTGRVKHAGLRGKAATEAA